MIEKFSLKLGDLNNNTTYDLKINVEKLVKHKQYIKENLILDFKHDSKRSKFVCKFLNNKKVEDYIQNDMFIVNDIMGQYFQFIEKYEKLEKLKHWNNA